MPTSVSLQLADRTLVFPRGVVEDVLVKVDKFIFPADFIVLDMEEDADVPIILGRPFLATGRTIIDVQKGELTMRVQDQEVTFNVFKAMNFPDDDKKEECFRLDVIHSTVPNSVERQSSNDKLKTSQMHREPKDKSSFVLKEPILALQATEEKKFHQLNELEEFHNQPFEDAKLYKEKGKKRHDERLVRIQLEPGQKVLLNKSRVKFFPCKPKSRWSGPFVITKVLPDRDVEIHDPDSNKTFKVKNKRVKHYWGESFERQKESVTLSNPA